MDLRIDSLSIPYALFGEVCKKAKLIEDSPPEFRNPKMIGIMLLKIASAFYVGLNLKG
jgi:hypothetical protein